EGKEAPLLITMPKGSYTISFESRQSAATVLNGDGADANDPPAPAPDDAIQLVTEAEIPPQPTIHPAPVPEGARASWGRPFWILLTIVMALIAIGCAALLLAQRNTQLSQRLANSRFPLGALFDVGKDTDIVTTDASLVLLRELSHKSLSLHDYITRQYPPVADSINQDLYWHVQHREYVDSNEVVLATKILRDYSQFSQRIFINSAREVDLPRLKERNVILLGSPASNPWGELYYQNLPFQFDRSQRGTVLNGEPRPGEQARYFAATRSGETGDTFALVAFVPGLGAGLHALLIAGTTAESTAAAGGFVLDEAQISKAYKMMGIERSGSPRYFELLLRARTFPGSATETTILAWRLLDPA
ncbi:MAG: hypothetical protein WBW33_09935, partial [Bryobacteraceae bacterium]